MVQSQQYFGIVTRIIVIIVAHLKKVLSTDGTIIRETFVRIEPASIFYLINMYYNGRKTETAVKIISGWRQQTIGKEIILK